MEVIKRDGRKEEYDISKIILVLQNANLSLDDVNMCSREDILKVSKSVDGVLHFKSNISTEQIQSIVETQLIKHGYVDLAKSYIIGCYENKVQYQMSKLDKSVLDIIAGENREVATENSNKNAQLISTQRDYIAGEVSKSLSKRFVFDKEAVDLHEKGIIHIHDMDYAIQPMLNCCLINLEDMFTNGTNINGVSIDTPKSLQTASTLTSQISAVVASANFGGQTINLGHLVPYVDVSRQKIKKQLTDNFKTLGIEISDDKVAKLVEEQLKQEIKSSVQTLNYQWNTMTSTNGQTAFISLFMYLNEKQDNLYQQDLALLIEEFLNQRLKGMKNRDGVYVSQTFPKLLYVLDETNHSKDKPFYYLTELSAMCTAKRMVPDYISEKIMHKYKVNSKGEGRVVAPMGCRSMLSVLDDNPDYLWGRANLGVCTINLPYIALQSNGDINEFWRFLDKYAKVIRRVQNTRYKKLLNVTSDISPTLWQYGVLARFKKGEKIAPYLTKDHCTISFGYAGLSEAVKYLTGMSHTDKSAHKFALSILQKLNDYCEQWKEEDNLGWSPYGTPRF